MHSHTKFGIPFSNNIGDNYAPDKTFLEMSPDVKVKVTLTQNGMQHSKMYPQTKFGIPTTNIGDMLRTRLF